MWQKIKNIFAIIGAALSVFVLTCVFFLLRRRDNPKRGCTDSSGLNATIKGGLTSSSARTERIQEATEDCTDGITRATDRITRCEDSLRRAEDILREAIEKSRSN